MKILFVFDKVPVGHPQQRRLENVRLRSAIALFVKIKAQCNTLELLAMVSASNYSFFDFPFRCEIPPRRMKKNSAPNDDANHLTMAVAAIGLHQ